MTSAHTALPGGALRVAVVGGAELEASIAAALPDADVARVGQFEQLLPLLAEASREGRARRVVFVDIAELSDDASALVSQARALEPVRFIAVIDSDAGGLAAAAIDPFDFVTRPISRIEVEFRFFRAVRDLQIELAARSGKQDARRRPRKSDVIIGQGAWIKKLYEQLNMAAPTDVSVAVFGESGTGKELVARTLHNLSQRFMAPFVVVNCAAIPENLLEDELFGHVRGAFTDASRDREGLFAAADGGTIFLDEIGEMSFALQAKLLRVLQSGEFRRVGDDSGRRVDVRVVTATNRDLVAMVTKGEFREDLFYRINVFPLYLPALRERPEDIPLLAHHFLLSYRDRVGKEIQGFSADAMAEICAHRFPGNVRELENVIHQALVMSAGPLVELRDVRRVGEHRRGASKLDLGRPYRELKREFLDGFERRYIERLLEECGGNLAAAARIAGMDRKNLWSLVKRHDVDASAYKKTKRRDD